MGVFGRRANPGGGGGLLSLKKGPNVARLLRSCGCREQRLQKRWGCPVIVNVHREPSNLFIMRILHQIINVCI